MEAVVADQVKERESHVRSVVSTLKSLADATEGASPRQAVERAGAKLLVAGIKHLNQPQVKEAAKPSSAIALAALAEKKIGPAFVDYDPEALRDLGFTDDEITKMMAAKVVLYDTEPFVHWHVFEKVAAALVDRLVMFDVTQDLTVAEVAWAVDAMRYLDAETPFSHEVVAYVAGLLHEEGFVVAPPVLAFAEGVLGALTSEYGRAVAARAKAGEGDPEALHQRRMVEQVMSFVNERHAALVAELRKV